MDPIIKEQFKRDSLKQLQELDTQQVELFSSINQLPPFVTIVAFPSPEVIGEIMKLIESLKLIDPNQFYYAPENLHLTILGNLPADLADAQIISAVKKVLPAQIEFEVEDLACNTRGPSICAYPISMDLKSTRDNLRRELNVKGDDYTSFISAYEHLAWINFARFLSKPQPSLLSYFLENKQLKLGKLQVGEFYFCRSNSRLLKRSDCIRID